MNIDPAWAELAERIGSAAWAIAVRGQFVNAVSWSVCGAVVAIIGAASGVWAYRLHHDDDVDDLDALPFFLPMIALGCAVTGLLMLAHSLPCLWTPEWCAAKTILGRF